MAPNCDALGGALSGLDADPRKSALLGTARVLGGRLT
jgi:hypothetical protein